MAKIKVLGQAVVVTSSIKLEDIKKVKKYRPDALILKGGEDGKEQIFALGVGEGSVNKYGASFNRETRDNDKLATMTLTTSYDGEDIQEHVADELGEALVKLRAIEEKFPAIIAEVDAERAAIMADITVG